jgi:hypothetical protein
MQSSQAIIAKVTILLRILLMKQTRRSSEETTFHVSGHIRRHNIRIWANERPHNFVEHESDSPKVNV